MMRKQRQEEKKTALSQEYEPHVSEPACVREAEYAPVYGWLDTNRTVSGAWPAMAKRTSHISRQIKEDPAAMVELVKGGIDVGELKSLMDDLDISQQTLAEVVNIRPRTLVRRFQEKAVRLTTDESERVLRIRLLVDRAVEILGGEEPARSWLKAPNYSLGGIAPILFSDTEPGAREVERLLGRIEHGVFA